MSVVLTTQVEKKVDIKSVSLYAKVRDMGISHERSVKLDLRRLTNFLVS